MNKHLHSILSVIVIFGSLIGLHRFVLPNTVDPFILFLVYIPIFVTLFLCIQQIPKKCDQKDCDGLARFYSNPNFNNPILRKLTFKGHKCEKCEHLIKPPKGNRNLHR